LLRGTVEDGEPSTGELDRRSRAEEPVFPDPTQAMRWRTARRAAIDHVLALISGSWWSEDLVLRGSLLLQSWVGERAREPADLDWVVVRNVMNEEWSYGNLTDLIRMWPAVVDGVVPSEIALGFLGVWEVTFPTEYLDQIIEIASNEEGVDLPYVDLLEQIKRWPEAAGGVMLDADGAQAQEREMTWSYYGSGIRLQIPWQVAGLPPGQVRVDFADDDMRSDPPVLALVPRGDGGPPVVVQTASRELSLAWKILWLQVGSEAVGGAQGKDLYDAVLLAEDDQTRLSPRLLQEILSSGDVHADTKGFDPNRVHEWTVAWEQFQAEYPWVQGGVGEWLNRLSRALDSMFAAPIPKILDIEVGDPLTITDGPFTGLQATTNEINFNSKKIKALVYIFGRETVVEFSFGQVQKD
jgi:hypothetical protein